MLLLKDKYAYVIIYLYNSEDKHMSEITDTSWVKDYLDLITTGKASPEELIAKKMPYINRPFYKYYSAPKDEKDDKKMYCINNLKNNILFLKDPSEFNDPFDCRIGMSTTKLYKYHCIRFFKSLNAYTPELEQQLDSLFCEANIKCVDIENARFICQNKIDQIIPQVANSLTTSGMVNSAVREGISMIFDKPPSITSSLLKGDMTVVKQQEYIDVLLRNNQVFRQHVANTKHKNITVDDALDAIIDNIKLRIEKYPDTCISGKEVNTSAPICKLNLATHLNKPTNIEQGIIDAFSDFRSFYSKMINIIQERIYSKFRVACLSERNDSTLMWSHYADDHKGVCFEYDFTHTKMVNPLYHYTRACLYHITYSNTRMDLADILTEPDIYEKLLNNEELPIDVFKKIYMSLLTKDVDWSYEKEWRIIMSDIPDQELPVPPVRKIFLGINVSEYAKKELIKIANEKRIPVFQMALSPNRFKLEWYPID